ncbi:hypothetical protein A3C23_05845 [Candidatus Roizmanbacteria bacterium RIFCSPHIGHO2_02_FULL_37_13b]|nr:MAG: hypothetical protein A3C23_05845 [Candidatus Roizmanbacteria bacterium RIFCSPHIGHO2_02_FULL_37_13b]
MQGQLQVSLDLVGIKQAQRTAHELKDQIFDALLSSDLPRTMQTAQKIAEKLNMDIISVPQLRERALGVLEGKHKNDVFKLLGIDENQEAHHIWLFQENSDLHEKFMIEKRDDMYRRIKTFVSDIRKQYKNKQLLIVSHGGTIRVLLYFLGFKDKEFLKKLPIKNASIIALKKQGTKYTIEQLLKNRKSGL